MMSTKRLSKQDSGGTIKYMYDMDKVVLERNAQDTTVASYTHEGGSSYYDLISMKRTNSYYYLFDGLGSVTELLDSNEATQNSYRYEVFGQIKSSTENVTNPYKYVGAYGVHDDSTAGLYFMQARYYMATVGRFITLDPCRGVPQDPTSLHRYVYVANSAVTLIDPTGYSTEDQACFSQEPWQKRWKRIAPGFFQCMKDEFPGGAAEIMELFLLCAVGCAIGCLWNVEILFGPCFAICAGVLSLVTLLKVAGCVKKYWPEVMRLRREEDC